MNWTFSGVRLGTGIASVLLASLPCVTDGQEPDVAPVDRDSREMVEDRAFALAAALRHMVEGIPNERLETGPFLLDTVRTATGEIGRSELLVWLADQIGADMGNVEDHCVRIQDRRVRANARVGLRQSAVRPASAVVAANITEWGDESGQVRVILWIGQGVHSGGSREFLVKRTDSRWTVASHLYSSTGGCIPPPREPRQVPVAEVDVDVLRRIDVGTRVYLSFLESIVVVVPGGILGVVAEEYKAEVWESGAFEGAVVEISEDPLRVIVEVR